VPQPDYDERPSSTAAATGPESFPSTHWSVVLAAGQSPSPAGQAALEKLCRTYWYPLYVYVRRRGYSPEDAQDLTQGFFERLLERDLLADLRPAGARFRSFLLHTMKNLLASEWTRAHAEKRGGTWTVVSLDELDPEARYALEAAKTETPDAAFERRWAGAVLRQAFDRLRQEQVAAGKEALFDCLADALTGAAIIRQSNIIRVVFRKTLLYSSHAWIRHWLLAASRPRLCTSTRPV